MFAVTLREQLTRKFLVTTLKEKLKPRDFCVYPKISLVPVIWRNSPAQGREPCGLISAPYSVALVPVNGSTWTDFSVVTRAVEKRLCYPSTIRLGYGGMEILEAVCKMTIPYPKAKRQTNRSLALLVKSYLIKSPESKTSSLSQSQDARLRILQGRDHFGEKQ